MEAAEAVAQAYPELRVLPVCADYTRPFELPRCEGATRTVVYFPGSTIGNFEPEEARSFLAEGMLLNTLLGLRLTDEYGKDDAATELIECTFRTKLQLVLEVSGDEGERA